MALLQNIRVLEKNNVQLQGDLAVKELDIDTLDDMIHLNSPLKYDLNLSRLGSHIIVQGTLEIVLNCNCVRCLRAFEHHIHLKDWICHIPLEGEEQTSIKKDCVDLTPFLREDILLVFPQHPLCETDCRGLDNPFDVNAKSSDTPDSSNDSESAWSKLDKLKL
jgi:uncharacterized protein